MSMRDYPLTAPVAFIIDHEVAAYITLNRDRTNDCVPEGVQKFWMPMTLPLLSSGMTGPSVTSSISMSRMLMRYWIAMMWSMSIRPASMDRRLLWIGTSRSSRMGERITMMTSSLSLSLCTRQVFSIPPTRALTTCFWSSKPSWLLWAHSRPISIGPASWSRSLAPIFRKHFSATLFNRRVALFFLSINLALLTFLSFHRI